MWLWVFWVQQGYQINIQRDVRDPSNPWEVRYFLQNMFTDISSTLGVTRIWFRWAVCKAEKWEKQCLNRLAGIFVRLCALALCKPSQHAQHSEMCIVWFFFVSSCAMEQKQSLPILTSPGTVLSGMGDEQLQGRKVRVREKRSGMTTKEWDRDV